MNLKCLKSSILMMLAAAGAMSLATSPSAHAAVVSRADEVVAAYEFDNPEANAVSLNFFQFGYTNDDGDFIPLIDNQIVSSRVLINFRPGLVDDGSGNMVPFDVDQLQVSMVVPVILDDPNGTEFFVVTGDQLQQTAPNTYSYELTTNAFNGLIRSGRFSLDIGAFDSAGDPVPMAGEFFGGSGFYYTVAVPEPGYAMAGVGAVLIGAMTRVGKRPKIVR